MSETTYKYDAEVIVDHRVGIARPVAVHVVLTERAITTAHDGATTTTSETVRIVGSSAFPVGDDDE